jgi:hypothetical protein
MIDMKARFEEVNAFEVAERRAATAATRMQQLDAIWRIAAELGIRPEIREGEQAPAREWARLREAINERNKLASE